MRVQRKCFPLKFAKFLRTSILKKICERWFLFLHVILFTMNEKDTANKAQLGPYQIYTMKFLCENI